jgi:hypothetical protein
VKVQLLAVIFIVTMSQLKTINLLLAGHDFLRLGESCTTVQLIYLTESNCQRPNPDRKFPWFPSFPILSLGIPWFSGYGYRGREVGLVVSSVSI